MLFIIFSILTLLSLITTSTALKVPATQPTASPVSYLPDVAFPLVTLAPRCENGGSCDGASTVSWVSTTSRVEVITTVPCYTTAYTTNFQTVTATISSTTVLTTTVEVDHFAPTPQVESSVYTRVVNLTEVFTSDWIETAGSSYEVTATGGTTTYGGGSAPSPTPTPSNGTPPPAGPPAQADHNGGCDSCEKEKGGGALHDDGGVQTVSGKNAVAVAGDGWSTAGATATAGYAVGAAGTPGSSVQWNDASSRAAKGWDVAMICGGAVAFLMLSGV